MPASTLRHYEAKGLIQPCGRRGLRRVFDDGIVERLALIALGRSAGFTLDDIKLMFAADGRLDLDRGLLMAKADELDRRVARLCAVRDGLRHAARCSAPHHLECPSFREIVRAATPAAGHARS